MRVLLVSLLVLVGAGMVLGQDGDESELECHMTGRCGRLDGELGPPKKFYVRGYGTSWIKEHFQRLPYDFASVDVRKEELIYDSEFVILIQAQVKSIQFSRVREDSVISRIEDREAFANKVRLFSALEVHGLPLNPDIYYLDLSNSGFTPSESRFLKLRDQNSRFSVIAAQEENRFQQHASVWQPTCSQNRKKVAEEWKEPSHLSGLEEIQEYLLSNKQLSGIDFGKKKQLIVLRENTRAHTIQYYFTIIPNENMLLISNGVFLRSELDKEKTNNLNKRIEQIIVKVFTILKQYIRPSNQQFELLLATFKTDSLTEDSPLVLESIESPYLEAKSDEEYQLFREIEYNLVQLLRRYQKTRPSQRNQFIKKLKTSGISEFRSNNQKHPLRLVSIL